MTNPSVYAQTSSAMAPRRMVAAAVLLAAAIGLCRQALVNAGQPTHAVAWGSVGFAAYAASLLCLVGGGQGKSLGLSRWRFGSWILLWYGAAFGLATLTWVQQQTGTPAQISQSSVLRALWLVALGMTLWALGYCAGPGRPARRLGNRAMEALSLRFTPEVRSPLAPWILYAIGTAATIASAVTTGRFGYVGDAQSAVTKASSYQQVLGLLSLCGSLAVTAAALQVYRERVPGARVTLTVLFLAEIALGAASGNKQGFIVTILAVAIPFTVARRRMHKGLLVFAVLTLLLLIVPFNQAYRGVARTGTETLSTGQAIDAAPGILAQTIASGNIDGVLSSTTFLLARIREIDSPAIIMQRTPEQIRFLSPVQLVEAPAITLIPRAVWPGKPLLDPGYAISQAYYGLSASAITSSAITPVGDLYRHGGWIPVLVGMFLLGCGTRLLDDVMDVSGNPQSIFLFLLLFPTLVKQENDWVGTLSTFPGAILVWLLAVYLTFRKKGAAAVRQADTGPAAASLGLTIIQLSGEEYKRVCGFCSACRLPYFPEEEADLRDAA